MNNDRFEAALAQWAALTRQELDSRVATPACIAFSRLAELSKTDPVPLVGQELGHLEKEKCQRCNSLLQRLRTLEQRKMRHLE